MNISLYTIIRNPEKHLSSHLVSHHVHLGDRQLLVCGGGTQGSTGRVCICDVTDHSQSGIHQSYLHLHSHKVSQCNQISKLFT